jgi:hypothetical protein
MNLNLQNKVLPVALVAALLGGTVGAFVMRDRTPQADTRVASANLLPASQQNAGSQAATLRYDDTAARGATTVAANNETPVVNTENQPTDESCYRAGFSDGFEAARKEANLTEPTALRSAGPQRVVYRSAPAARRARSSRSARTVYYDYEQPRKRSFWSPAAPASAR